jgi:hypothetical protein
MLAEVSETRPFRKLIAYQLLSRKREQHLPTVGCDMSLATLFRGGPK